MFDYIKESNIERENNNYIVPPDVFKVTQGNKLINEIKMLDYNGQDEDITNLNKQLMVGKYKNQTLNDHRQNFTNSTAHNFYLTFLNAKYQNEDVIRSKTLKSLKNLQSLKSKIDSNNNSYIIDILMKFMIILGGVEDLAFQEYQTIMDRIFNGIMENKIQYDQNDKDDFFNTIKNYIPKDNINSKVSFSDTLLKQQYYANLIIKNNLNSVCSKKKQPQKNNKTKGSKQEVSTSSLDTVPKGVIASIYD